MLPYHEREDAIGSAYFEISTTRCSRSIHVSTFEMKMLDSIDLTGRQNYGGEA
jgi:hypothetical protein